VMKDERENCCSSCLWVVCCPICSSSQLYKEAKIYSQENPDQSAMAAPASQVFGSKQSKRKVAQQQSCIMPQTITV
jgi:hypothetical protein